MTPSTTFGVVSKAYVDGEAIKPSGGRWKVHATSRVLTFSRVT